MKIVQKKVCMLGSFAVGKTSLVKRFVEGRFDDRYLSTIGVKISRKTIEHDAQKTNMIVWDLAGGDEYIRTNTSYLRGAAGAIIVCDLTRAQTLSTAREYAQQIRSLNAQAGIVFLGNKCDLVNEREISDLDLQAIVDAFDGSAYHLTSAKTGESVESSFEQLAGMI